MSQKDKNNVLVVAAHPDDEVLGAGGTILKHVKGGDEVAVLILGEGESSKGKGADIEKRKEQAGRAAELLGVKNLFLEGLPDNRFDSLSFLELVKITEKCLNRIKPSIVYTHHHYDLNIDHRLSFQAVLTACRPQPKHFVKKLLSFEVPSSTEWQFKDRKHQFFPTVYNDITDFIEQKIKVLAVYEDELKEYPHPRSKQGVKILSQYRGIEAGYCYAEAFQLIRGLED